MGIVLSVIGLVESLSYFFGKMETGMIFALLISFFVLEP
jgi:hypothetical protein